MFKETKLYLGWLSLDITQALEKNLSDPGMPKSQNSKKQGNQTDPRGLGPIQFKWTNPTLRQTNPRVLGSTSLCRQKVLGPIRRNHRTDPIVL